jgi:uncharacterized RDD family membrane protein YckC
MQAHQDQVKKDTIKNLKTVSIGYRFAHFIIDFIFMYILIFIFAIIMGIFQLNNFAEYIKNHSFLFGVISFFIYYVICEYTLGRTLGKFFTKSMVVTEDGRKPSFTAVVLRSLIRNIPFEPLSVLSASSKMWHDTLSKTVVTKVMSVQTDTELQEKVL